MNKLPKILIKPNPVLVQKKDFESLLDEFFIVEMTLALLGYKSDEDWNKEVFENHENYFDILAFSFKLYPHIHTYNLYIAEYAYYNHGSNDSKIKKMEFTSDQLEEIINYVLTHKSENNG